MIASARQYVSWALARFVMTLSEGFAVHAAAGASRDDLQASVDIAMRAVAALHSGSEEQQRDSAATAGATVAASGKGVIAPPAAHPICA